MGAADHDAGDRAGGWTVVGEPGVLRTPAKGRPQLTTAARGAIPESRLHVDPEPQAPYPPRLWWLKRLSLLCVLVAAALVGLRLWWGWEAQRRLDRVLQPVRAAGLPVLATDMKRQSLTDEINAAAYLRKASASIVFNDSPAASNFSFPDYPPYGSQWDTLAEKSVAQNAKIFPLARQARVRPG